MFPIKSSKKRSYGKNKDELSSKRICRRNEEIKTINHSKDEKDDDIKTVQVINSESNLTLVIPTLATDWVRASSTRNYALGDPLIDWLDLYGEKTGFVPDEKQPGYDKRLDFKQFILEQGHKFEARIMAQLRQRFGDEIVEITSVIPARQMSDTLDAMKRGIPIIAQGHIWEPKSKVHGHPDLLVRSDYLNRIVQTPITSNNSKGCRWSPNWHYRVVDIKFSTLHFKADFTTLLNKGSIKAFKLQLCVYQVCLNFLQDYDPKRAYLLGRGWDATKRSQTFYSKDPFSRLGIVDFSKEDLDSVALAAEATTWIKRCSLQGSQWKILNIPSVPELYPNMCNTNASGWDNAKKLIANELKEITLMWQCGKFARDEAHSRDIFTWDDPDLTAANLGIKGPKMEPLVNSIISINRDGPDILPEKITNSLYDWRNAKNNEFFLDIETVSSIHSLENDSEGLIYMIGIGRNDDGKWDQKTFIVGSLTLEAEENLIYKFLESFPKSESEDVIKLYHYGSADSVCLNKAFDRIRMNASDFGEIKDLDVMIKRLVFCDLYTFIRSEPVLIKGALDFGLKSIVSALSKQGKIQITYEGSSIGSGMDGTMAALSAASQNQVPFKEYDLIQESTKYNMKDCQALFEILQFFRENL